MRRWLVSLCILLLPAATVQAAGSRVDIQLFQPSPSASAFFTTESGLVQPHLHYNVGLNVNYGHNLLKISAVSEGSPATSIGTVVGNRIDFDLMGSIGLFNWVELGFVMPLVVQGGFDAAAFNTGTVQISKGLLPSFTPGDLRIVPKVNLWNVDKGLFAGGIIAQVTVPTAGGAEFSGEGATTPVGWLAMSSQLGPVRLGLDAGYKYRSANGNIAGIIIDDEIVGKFGAGLLVNPGSRMPVEIVGEVFGGTQAKHPFDQNQYLKAGTAAEGAVGLKITVADSYTVSFGGGGGLIPGIGAPVPRLFIGVAYDSNKVHLPDLDNDGVPDEIDKCRDREEDRDGFQDDDGCPDVDNDHDNIVDEDDQCPNDPEDKDGFEDEDGCPELDNDKDGVPDTQDKCPNQVEDKDGINDEDGCPELDNDNDGVPDTADKCPSEAEDLDSFEDFDGCPEPDNDKDGQNDLNDQCPNIPEDMDGVADDDGCPEDNDGDGIPDEKDKCPNQAETYNGIKDDDGCPDALEKKSLVEVTEDKIEIKEAVFFKASSSAIDKRSFEMLDQVAAVMRNYKSITSLRIEGHTDNGGARAKNVKLSQDRANEVRKYLISKGIAGDRLVAKGFGPDKPIASNKTPSGKEKNRRVEFVIDERAPLGEEVKQAEAPPPPSPPANTGGAIDMGGFGDAPAPPPAVAPAEDSGGDLFDVGPGEGKHKGKKGKKAKGKKKDDSVNFGF